MLFVPGYLVDVSLCICIIKKRSKLAAVTLQPRQKKEKGTLKIFWACTVQFSRPLAVLLRGAVGESLSDF